jgi:hypothetical protein
MARVSVEIDNSRSGSFAGVVDAVGFDAACSWCIFWAFVISASTELSSFWSVFHVSKLGPHLRSYAKLTCSKCAHVGLLLH